MDGIDTSLLDSLDPSVCEARVSLIFRLSSILTLVDNSVCFSRTTMIPPDCLEDCLPWINLAARAWMGNLEVGRDAALLGGTRREKKGLQEIGNSNTGPLLHVLKSKISTNDGCASKNRSGGGDLTIWQLLWAGIQQLDGLLGLATNNSQQLAHCFFSALLIPAARKHSNARDSSFFLDLIFLYLSCICLGILFLPASCTEARAPQQIWRG